MIPVGWLGRENIENCYEVLDSVFPACGLYDFTEGIFSTDQEIQFSEIQEKQYSFILDELKFEPGQKILDIGCGNGGLLNYIRDLKGEGVGVTISPQQAERCRQWGLEVYLLDYREMATQLEWHSFDGIIANGSMEHFVQARDAAAGHGDAIYRNLFYLCHRLLKRESASRRLVTTCIHFGDVVLNPFEVMGSPFFKAFKSNQFYYTWLVKCFGGFYPYSGQLARCSAPFFSLDKEVDGTFDYERTSEIWLKEIRDQLWRKKWGWPLWRLFLKSCRRAPIHSFNMLVGLLLFESWQWQFRGPKPPMQLLRQTWSAPAPII